MHVEENASLNKISEILGVSSHTVRKTLKDNNIQSRTKSVINVCPDIEKLKELYISNTPTIEIAKEFNVRRGLIYKWFKRYDIKSLTKKDIPLTDLEKDIIRLHKDENVSLSKIAEMLDSTYHIVKKTLENNNIDIVMQSTSKPNICPDVDKLRKLIKNRIKMSEIGEEFGVSSSLICTWCKRNNIEVPTNEITLPIAIVEEYKTTPAEEIAKKYNVSSPTVLKNLREYGVTIRSPSEFVKLAVPKIAETKLKNHGYEYFPPDMEYKRSKAELEMESFYNNQGFDFKSDRTVLSGNLELDLYSEKHKKAVELCGLIYHCEGLFNNRGKEYHYNKWKECDDKGIQLYTIFSHELKHKKDKIYNFLNSQLGIFEERIYARDCEFKEIYDRSLIEKWHIQGNPRNIQRGFSLTYKDEIVGTVTYAKHHRNFNIMSLNRLCFKSGLQVVGGASRLLKNSLKEMNQPIVTWSDNRLSNGQIYANSGFELDIEYKPDYFYTNVNEDVRSKQSMQKKKIGCPEHMTEREFCYNNGWFRVYDCGKRKWIFKGI